MGGLSENMSYNSKEILQCCQIKCVRHVFILVADLGERDFLPHQEAMMKAGLEKATKHKDKLLEYDRTR